MKENHKKIFYFLVIILLIVTFIITNNTVKASKVAEEKMKEEKRIEAIAKEKEIEKEPEKTEEQQVVNNPVDTVDPLKKIVYLTFDDGPNKYTEAILDVLKEKDVKATFFLLGRNIEERPETVKRTVYEGHYPGLHSMSHDKKKLYQGKPMQVAYEMEQARKAVYAITGFNSRLVRVPYGSKPYMKEEFRDGLATYWFKMWDWTTDSKDWQYKEKNSYHILENIKAQVTRDVEVVLMHDSKGTLEQLPAIIDYIREAGYEIQAYDPEHHVSINFWGDERF